MNFGDNTWFFSKHKWKILVLILVVIVLVSYFFFNVVEKNKNSTQSTTEFIFKEDRKTVEVRVDTVTNETKLFENNKYKETLSFVPRKANPVIVLPESKKSLDIITKRAPISDLTWESSLEDSAKYLNFLDSEGYEIVREAHTSQFIELTLESNKVKKRVVIFTNILMVGDLDKDAKSTTVKEYLKEYRK
jgi:regulatory protein YycI of two-component signal transduction system YycFG